MTDSSEGGGKGPAKPGGEPPAPKKPIAIIDLKATEIDNRQSKAAGAPGKPETERPGSPAASGSPGKPAEARAGAAAAPPVNPAQSKPADTPRPAPAAASARPAVGKDQVTANAIAGQRRSFSFGSAVSHMLAGLVGGFLALVGADTITSQLGLPAPQAVAPAPELARRIASLEQAARERPAGQSSDAAQKLAAAEARLAAVEDLGRTVKQLGDSQAQLANNARLLSERLAVGGDAAARLSKLEETFSALSAAAANDPQKGQIPQLAALAGRIKDLETSIGTQISALRQAVGQELDGRFAQTSEAAEAAMSGAQRVDRDVATVKTDAARLAQRIDGLKTDADRLGAQVKALEEGSGGLRSALGDLKADTAAQLLGVARPQDVAGAIVPLTTRLATLEADVQGVVKSEEGRRANAERIVLALELGNLRRAIDRGGSFAAELAEVQKAGGTRLDLAALEKVKDQGVPTVADLSRDFRDVAHAIVEGEAEPDGASVVDRLVSGAKSIVRVRRVSAAPDDTSAEAIVARMEAALKAHRFAAVADEAKKLSARAAAPAKAWLAKLESRAAIDRALANVEAQLKSALGGKG